MGEFFGNAVTKLLGNRVYFLLVLMVIVVIIMSSISPYFFTTSNLLSMTRFGAVLALLAIGQSLVILAGGAGIDLSIGAILSLAGVLFGMMVQDAGINIWLAISLTIIVGGLLGAVNSVIVAWWGLPPLIATLGTLWAYGALALVLTNGVPISGFPETFAFISQGYILGIPTQILLVVVPAYLILQFVASRTRFGRWIYLLGVNDEAARFAGIPVTRVRFILYTLNGVLAGLSAIIMASWFMAARPDVGAGMDLQSITVAVLGGIYIFGGIGSLAGSMLAVLIVTMVATGLQLANINTVWQLAVLGFMLLGAVALNQVVVQTSARKQGLQT
jgi:ribose/xylose/arabinose/galactoside ABC-type transport system permease subunit